MDVDAILQQLKEQGLKPTPQRLEILKILVRAIQPLTAKEIIDAVHTIYPNVSLDTVYRNLTMLTDQGLVNQINLQNRESARFEFQGHGHHHHFICLSCGKSFCVDSCPTPLVTDRPVEDPGFRVMGHAFEVYGYCSPCQVTAVPTPPAPHA